ncbi:MAG TPA: DHA2 family efflux MFS transporter permease subunit [Terriglobales bacterium]|nr:DHA2 family efflux MFS transporter permease subunit [Terriglobales bacterium]
MSAGSIALSPEQSIPRPAINPWVIAAVVAMAAFMEILDTSIANVALPYMAGNLGASNDESTWVLTSYLVSNAIILPISGWLAGAFGRKRFFMLCLITFTISSLLCGMAPSLGLLLLFRVLQGAGGGGLQPMAQAILADTFPPSKRGLAFALYGVTAVMAPTIGPTLGGWITFNYSWRWIFFINLPVGIVALLLVYRLIQDPPYLARVKSAGVKLDYIGVTLLVLGIGALQILLDKGQEEDWFGSQFITSLVVISVVCLVALVIWELYSKHPVIDVRMFKNFNYTGACVMIFMLGVLLFSSLVLMPQFLQTLLGYTAELAGLVLTGGAVLLLFIFPLVGKLTSMIQARYIIAFGWLCLSLAMFYSTLRIDLQISFASAAWLRVIQQVGLGFLFVPITLVSYVGIPAEKSNSVAGMVNFFRNIGSSVGTSMVTTLIARRSQFHHNVLVNHATASNQGFNRLVTGLTHRFTISGASPHDAQAHAYALAYRQLQAQAATLSYIDVFWILSVIAGIMFFLSFLLRKNDPHGGGETVVAH